MSPTNSRYPRRRRRQKNEAGLTLVELLVSITLTGLLMVVLFGGLQFGVRAWETGSNQIERFAEIDAARGFLRRALAQAVPVAALEKDEDPLGIIGQQDRLSFVMIPPPHLADGHYYRLQVYGEAHDQSNRMVLERRPLEVSEGTLTDERDSHIVSLLDGIETLEVVYFGSDNDKDAPSWRRQWTDTTRPPILVRVAVTFPEGDDRLWPDLVIRPMIDEH